MAKYQVQYKNNSSTFTDTFEANSHLDIINFFQVFINAEITEIREIIYTNSFYPKDDGDYIKFAKIRISDDLKIYSFKIPKLKKSKVNDLVPLVRQYIKLNGKTPKNISKTIETQLF